MNLINFKSVLKNPITHTSEKKKSQKKKKKHSKCKQGLKASRSSVLAMFSQGHFRDHFQQIV